MKLFIGLVLSCFLWSNVLASNVTRSVPQICYQIQQQLENKLPTTFTLYYPIKKRQLCILESRGTGDVFEKNKQTFRAWNKLLIKTLHKHGWYNTKRTLIYAANGPYSTTFAYRYKKSRTIAVVNFDVTGNIANCPKDEPMDLYQNCGLTPAGRNYVLRITLQK